MPGDKRPRATDAPPATNAFFSLVFHSAQPHKQYTGWLYRRIRHARRAPLLHTHAHYARMICMAARIVRTTTRTNGQLQKIDWIPATPAQLDAATDRPPVCA